MQMIAVPVEHQLQQVVDLGKSKTAGDQQTAPYRGCFDAVQYDFKLKLHNKL